MTVADKEEWYVVKAGIIFYFAKNLLLIWQKFAMRHAIYNVGEMVLQKLSFCASFVISRYGTNEIYL